METMEIGKFYDIKHSRKGGFRIQCTGFIPATNDFPHPTADGIIVEGMADAMLDYNRLYKGEAIRMTNGLFSWKEVK